MKSIRILAVLTFALLATSAFATIQSGKVEWVWQNAKGTGEFSFKLIGEPMAFVVDYNYYTNPMSLSQVLTAKAGGFNLAIDYSARNSTERTVNSLNVMNP
jgi:hypothetical protein